MSDAERKSRANNYILGLMDADERERAERDLELDPAFRETVVAVAERMHLFDVGRDGPAGRDAWRAIAASIAELPHMQRLDGRPALEAVRTEAPKPIGRGLQSTGTKRETAIAIGLLVAFALGYAAGSLAPPW